MDNSPHTVSKAELVLEVRDRIVNIQPLVFVPIRNRQPRKGYLKRVFIGVA